MDHIGDGVVGALAVIFIFGAPWVALVAIFIVPRYFKSIERRKVQDTIRAAIDSGHPLPPEVLEAMTRDIRPSTSNDARRGVIWLAIGVGVAGFGYAISYYADEALPPFLAIAAIPGAVGLAYLLLALVSRGRR